MSTPMNNKLLSTKKVAIVLGVTSRTVAKWLRDGELEGIKINARTWRVREEDLEDFIASRRVSP